MKRMHPESSTSRPGLPGALPGRGFAIGGALTAAIAGSLLLVDTYRHRNPEYSCSDVRPDWQALNIDVTVVDGIGASYGWWPFGLTCHFPRIGGGVVTVGPDPLLSIVLLCFLGGIAITVAGLVAVGIASRRISRNT